VSFAQTAILDSNELLLNNVKLFSTKEIYLAISVNKRFCSFPIYLPRLLSFSESDACFS